MTKILVTGGTSGLGRAISERFLDAGCEVLILGRDPKSVRALTVRPGCRFVRQDLLARGAAAKVRALVDREKIDCFVNNAGVYSDRGVGLPDADCVALLQTNLLVPVLILKGVYAGYKARRAGTIVSVNSLAGFDANFSEAVYCASKHGLRGFVRSLQIDAARHGVRIFDYHLGAMRTRMTRGRDGADSFIDPADVASRIAADVLEARSFLAVSQELRRVPR